MLTKLKLKIEDRILKDQYFSEFEALPDLELAPPPPHIDADISLVWAMAAAKQIRKNPLDIAKKAKLYPKIIIVMLKEAFQLISKNI